MTCTAVVAVLSINNQFVEIPGISHNFKFHGDDSRELVRKHVLLALVDQPLHLIFVRETEDGREVAD